MRHLQQTLRIFITGSLLLCTNSVYSPVPATTNFSVSQDQKYAIFDLHGVLIRTCGEMHAVGLRNFLKYALNTLPNPFTLKDTIKSKFFGFLNEIEPLDRTQPLALDPEGTPVPQLMCNWLKGTESTAVILQKIAQHAEQKPQTAELSLLLAICRMTFSPEHFIATQEWVPEGLALARELKGRGYKIFILSNWDSESFELLKAYYPEILAPFDGVLISGNAKSIKPDVNPGNIYEQLLKQYAINPARAVFIDDLPVNVHAAEKAFGIHGILCKQQRIYTKPWSRYPDITQVRHEVNAWEHSLGTPYTSPAVIA